MQPASAGGGDGNGSSKAWKRWGPIAGVVAVIAIVVGILVATSGDDTVNGTAATQFTGFEAIESPTSSCDASNRPRVLMGIDARPTQAS